MLPINNIYCGDFMEYLKQIDDNTIDLTVTSPPYDNQRTYENTLVWNDAIWKPLFVELYRVTKDGGVVTWVVNDMVKNGSKTLTMYKQSIWAKEHCGFNVHEIIYYKKKGLTFPDVTRYHQQVETIFVFSKGRPKTLNLLEDRLNKCVGEKPSGRQRQLNGSFKPKVNKERVKKYGKRFNFWEYSAGKHHSTNDTIAFDHPAIMPERLAGDLIKSYSNEGDIVLDPMCGSGTTIKQAIRLNRNYIGIDKIQKYVNITEKRIQNLF